MSFIFGGYHTVECQNTQLAFRQGTPFHGTHSRPSTLSKFKLTLT